LFPLRPRSRALSGTSAGIAPDDMISATALSESAWRDNAAYRSPGPRHSPGVPQRYRPGRPGGRPVSRIPVPHATESRPPVCSVQAVYRLVEHERETGLPWEASSATASRIFSSMKSRRSRRKGASSVRRIVVIMSCSGV